MGGRKRREGGVGGGGRKGGRERGVRDRGGMGARNKGKEGWDEGRRGGGGGDDENLLPHCMQAVTCRLYISFQLLLKFNSRSFSIAETFYGAHFVIVELN